MEDFVNVRCYIFHALLDSLVLIQVFQRVESFIAIFSVVGFHLRVKTVVLVYLTQIVGER